MVNNAISYRELREEDLSALCPLMKMTFQADSTQAYWHWKFFENPLKEHASFVAFDSDRLIALAGAVPYRLKVREHILTGAHLVDLMVHPEWRNKNIFSVIMRMMIAKVIETMDIMYGFTNEKSKAIFEQYYGSVSNAPRLDRPLNMEQFVKKVMPFRPLSKLTTWTANEGLRFLSHIHRIKPKRGIHITEAKAFDNRADILWGEASKEFPIATVRDARYLNWRYSNHPIYNYHILLAEDQYENLLGFIVLRIHALQNGSAVGFIVDLLVQKHRSDAAGALLSTSIEYFQKQKLDGIRGWMYPQFNWNNIFKKNLFFQRGSSTVLMAHAFSDKVDNTFLLDPRNWYVTMGDRDSN